MLLKSLSATNAAGDTLELPINDTAGFAVRDVLGVGPVKATLVSSGYATLDGEYFHTSRLTTRNLVIKLGLSPDLAVESAYSLRSQLYDFFMPKDVIELTFVMKNWHDPDPVRNTLAVTIEGVVESLEPTLFTREPGVDISVICYDPDFLGAIEVLTESSSTEQMPEIEIDYLGSSPTGLIIEVLANRTMPKGFTISHIPPNSDPGDVLEFFVDYAVAAGEIIRVNSQRGERSVTLITSGVYGSEISILYSVAETVPWLALSKGTNLLGVYDGDDVTPVPVTIEYQTRYGGL